MACASIGLISGCARLRTKMRPCWNKTTSPNVLWCEFEEHGCRHDGGPRQPEVMCHGMANKVIPLRKTPPKPNAVAAARRTLVLRADELEISVEITAEARRCTPSAVPTQTQSKVLP